MTRRGHRHLDEDDVRIRPGRGKSRPRSKERPGHADAVPGTVTAVDRGRFAVLLDATAATADIEAQESRTIAAVKAREIGRKGLVVGDRVRVVGDLAPDGLARVIAAEDRATVLRRTADDTDPVERIIVANADRLAIVTAVADPEPRPGLIDRALVAAYDGGLDPLLVVTKNDLADPAGLIGLYATLDVPAFGVRRGGDLTALREALTGHVTVLVGHSGVGKSTLVNALVPGAERLTGRVNEVTGRGRHTSSSAIALPMHDGWIIDTPGIRSLGLAHVDVARIIHAFPDLEAATGDCPRGCSHDEPECGLDAWAADQGSGAEPGRGIDEAARAAARVDSLRRLLRSREDRG